MRGDEHDFIGAFAAALVALAAVRQAVQSGESFLEGTEGLAAGGGAQGVLAGPQPPDAQRSGSCTPRRPS